jgi:AcrR family transcriptional regulator
VTIVESTPDDRSRVRGEYRKSARRREEIVAAAFGVFSRVGYLNASMAEIAKGAHLTVPGLTHHFPTKAALLESVFDRRDLDANSHLEGRTGLDMLRGLVEIAERDENDTALTRMFAILASEATDPEHPAHDYFRGRYGFILGFVERAFTEAAAAGELRAELDPADAARAYVALSDGLQLQRLYDPEAVSQATLIKRILESFLTRPL